jgi:hypothetical protein
MKRIWIRSLQKEIRREELFLRRKSKAPPKKAQREMSKRKIHSARKRGEERTMTLISLAISIGLLIRWMKMKCKESQEAARRLIITMSTREKTLILMMDSKQ